MTSSTGKKLADPNSTVGYIVPMDYDPDEIYCINCSDRVGEAEEELGVDSCTITLREARREHHRCDACGGRLG